MSLSESLPLLCFILSYIATKKWLNMCEERKLVSRDIHKKVRRVVPRIGGLPPALISTFAVFFLEFGSIYGELILLTSLTAILIGLLDDSISLSDLEKVLLPAASFIPLGFYLDSIEVFGLSFRGYLVPALVILLGTFSSNATNTLAGFNGLEAGLSVIISSVLSLFAYLKGNRAEMLLLATFSACYLAFLIFNFYPARAFPGNCSTFQMGSFLASVSIVGGLITPFLILMLPHALDFLLKLLSWRRMKEKRPTTIDENGFLVPPPHLSLIEFLLRLKRMKEPELVLYIYLIEAILGLFSLIITFIYFP